jgi:hypothetical protein
MDGSGFSIISIVVVKNPHMFFCLLVLTIYWYEWYTYPMIGGSCQFCLKIV